VSVSTVKSAVSLITYTNRRVGLSKADDPHSTGAVLTKTVSDFLSRWDMRDHIKPTNKMDFMWSSIGDEHREKTLLGEAFSTIQSLPSKLTSANSLLNGVAESVLKVGLASYFLAFFNLCRSTDDSNDT